MSRVLLQIRWRRAPEAEKQHIQQPGGSLAWEVVDMGWRCCRRRGQGRVAKGLECRDEQGRQGGVLRQGGHVWSLETRRMVQSRNSGLGQPGFNPSSTTDISVTLGRLPLICETEVLTVVSYPMGLWK